MQVDNPLNATVYTDTIQPPAPALLTLTRRPGDEGTPLDRSRLNDIRGKILSGAYHSLATAEEVARHILHSGDLTRRSGL